MPHHVAISRIAIRYESATVVGLTWTAAEYTAVMSAIAPIEAATRPALITVRTTRD